MLLGQALITADNKRDTEEVVTIQRAALCVPGPASLSAHSWMPPGSYRAKQDKQRQTKRVTGNYI
jgi:hypothetical protein